MLVLKKKKIFVLKKKNVSPEVKNLCPEEKIFFLNFFLNFFNVKYSLKINKVTINLLKFILYKFKKHFIFFIIFFLSKKIGPHQI